MAIMSRMRGLAFCKSSDTTWTSIGDWVKEFDELVYHDVIFYSKSKQFYALHYNGEVVSIDFQEGEKPTLLQVALPDVVCSGAVKAYLVEDLSGDLLLVSKTKEMYRLNYRLTTHKLDLVRREWTQVHSLGNIILFLGISGSIARSLSHCPRCQTNCIYFTEDIHAMSPNEYLSGPPGSGIYKLDDDTVRAHYGPKRSMGILPAPIWLEPTIFPNVEVVGTHIEEFGLHESAQVALSPLGPSPTAPSSGVSSLPRRDGRPPNSNQKGCSSFKGGGRSIKKSRLN